MADFDPPFADENVSKRFATVEEVAQGFPCGPADRDLFNMLLHQIQAEIGEVITYAGIAHTNARNTLLREAIVDLITPYLDQINGDSDGGTIIVNANRQFVLRMSDGTEWTLQLPTDSAGREPEIATMSLVETGGSVSSVEMSGSSGVGHEYDPDNILSYSGGNITIAKTGWVMMTSQVLATSNIGGYMQALILVNGSSNFQNAAPSYPNTRIYNPISGEASVAVCLRRLNAGDVVRFGAGFSSTGGNAAWGEGSITYMGY